MSILIKGMEMPKDCGHCRFAVDGWCYAYGRANIDALSTYERTDFCPLVELPPHGRLIDADALIVDLMDRGVEGLQTDDWYEIRQAVEDAPTIVEAEGEK